MKLVEGVTYNKKEGIFSFDFLNDDNNDIIKLKNIGYKSDIFNNCYYYGYEFESNVESYLRTLFIKNIKFPDDSISEKDKNTFIGNAVRWLDSNINLLNYNVIIYPQSMSELCRDMLKYLVKFTDPKYISIEVVKKIPSKIEFDYERFNIEVLDAILPNGRPRYTDIQKNDVITKIKNLMNNIHKNDYFSIARNIKKTKYRSYIKNYYKFKNKQDKKIFRQLVNNNILIIDDIVTSGATIFNLLKTIRSLNDKNNITVFSLLGKNIEI
ncbi:hypothetical protein J6O48_06755 [bacterium]|nr:hypothetical protein [bacterium]